MRQVFGKLNCQLDATGLSNGEFPAQDATGLSNMSAGNSGCDKSSRQLNWHLWQDAYRVRNRSSSELSGGRRAQFTSESTYCSDSWTIRTVMYKYTVCSLPLISMKLHFWEMQSCFFADMHISAQVLPRFLTRPMLNFIFQKSQLVPFHP